jgi:hypothetical protein
MANWIFDPHGGMRSRVRDIPGAVVDIVLDDGQDVRDGWLEDSVIRRARINGGEAEVLYLPGDPIRVHSVWWVKE